MWNCYLETKEKVSSFNGNTLCFTVKAAVSIRMNTHTVKYCLDTSYMSIKLSFLFTCCKVKTLGYNKFYCSQGSFKQWQNTPIVKTNVFIEQLVTKHFTVIKLHEVIYFIRVCVKMLHHTVMTCELTIRQYIVLCFFMNVCFLFLFISVDTQLHKSHYKPSLPDRVETY